MHAFTHPSLTGIQMGTRQWFAAQREMIRDKPLIQRCYGLWYRFLLEDADAVPREHGTKCIVELGSGSSYIKELRPEIITSDVAPGIADMVIDGRVLPFADESVHGPARKRSNSALGWSRASSRPPENSSPAPGHCKVPDGLLKKTSAQKAFG